MKSKVIMNLLWPEEKAHLAEYTVWFNAKTCLPTGYSSKN